MGAVLAAIVTALAFLGLGLLLLLLTVSEENADSALVFNVSLAVLVVVIAATAWIFGPGMHGGGLRSLGLRPPQIAGNAPWLMPPLVLLAVLVFNGVYTSVVNALGIEVLRPQVLPFEEYGASALLFSGTLVALAGPFAEELFFRGLVMRGFVNRWGPTAGILVSAAIFSIAHANIAVLIPIFVAGLLLGWLYHRTGSLWGCVWVHATQNAVAFSAALFL